MKKIIVFGGTNDSDNNTMFKKIATDKNIILIQATDFSTCRKDDENFMKFVNDSILESNIIIFACPEWNYNVPWHFKQFIDSIHYKLFKGKEARLVVWSGNDYGGNSVRDALVLMAHHLGMNVSGKIVCLNGKEDHTERLKELMGD